MKVGDKILIKSTNEITTIFDFPQVENKESYVYAKVEGELKIYSPDEFYLLVDPSLKYSHSDFMNFLDDNPPTQTPEPKELTKREKELIWLADFEAEQRYNDQNNSFYL